MDNIYKQVDLPKIEKAVREMLEAIGEDPNREGLKDTPNRVARMFCELFRGSFEDPKVHTERIFHEDYNEIVVLKDIPFASTCEHHLMPFLGKAHVAYLPGGSVLGISKLARIVDNFARRPQIQERMTVQIADFLMESLTPRGVAVVIEASHSCMTVRGVQKPGSVMTTSALRGIFIKDQRSRSEVLDLIGCGR